MRHRLGGSAPGLSLPSATSRFVGEPLALGAFQRERGALGVVHAELLPVGIPEIELGQIPLQVGFRNVVVHAVDAPLQDGEVAFHGVGVDGPILTAPVSHGARIAMS